MMLILPQVKELQRADLVDQVGGSGVVLQTGVWRNISGTFDNVSADNTVIYCLNMNCYTITLQASDSSTYSAFATGTLSSFTSIEILTKGLDGTSGGTGGGAGGGPWYWYWLVAGHPVVSRQPAAHRSGGAHTGHRALSQCGAPRRADPAQGFVCAGGREHVFWQPARHRRAAGCRAGGSTGGA